MTTIHDTRMGSEAAQLRAALNRERRARAVLGRAKDALEVILGAGGVGFCRILATRRAISANAHFKAHFGWPPDALIERAELEARIHKEDRVALAQALSAALSQDTPLDLTVRAVWPCGTTQRIVLRGRSVRADIPEGAPLRHRPARELVLIASHVTAERDAMQERADSA
jgi:hypothetical protein